MHFIFIPCYDEAEFARSSAPLFSSLYDTEQANTHEKNIFSFSDFIIQC